MHSGLANERGFIEVVVRCCNCFLSLLYSSNSCYSCKKKPRERNWGLNYGAHDQRCAGPAPATKVKTLSQYKLFLPTTPR